MRRRRLIRPDPLAREVRRLEERLRAIERAPMVVYQAIEDARDDTEAERRRRRDRAAERARLQQGGREPYRFDYFPRQPDHPRRFILPSEVEPFWMIVWDETADGAAIVQSNGGGWTLVARPELPPLVLEDVSFPDNDYSYMVRLGQRHYLVRAYNASLVILDRRWEILVSDDLATWTQDVTGSPSVAGIDGNDTHWWRTVEADDVYAAQLSEDAGEMWATQHDFWPDDPTIGGDVAVHPTENVAAFVNFVSSQFALNLFDGTFSIQEFVDAFALNDQLLGREGFADVNAPIRLGKYHRFTDSGRLLILQLISARGNLDATSTDFLLLFRSDPPYTGFSYTVIAGPHAHDAWGNPGFDLEHDGQIGIAMSRDPTKLFMYSNHSPDGPAPDGPPAMSPAEGHVYMSADDGETVTELASPGGIVRGLYYHAPINTLFAQMKDGRVLRMSGPGSEGAAWSDGTANLLSVLGSESVIPYVNNGIWA